MESLQYTKALSRSRIEGKKIRNQKWKMRPRNAEEPQRIFCQPHNKFDNLKEMNKFWDKYILLILKQEETKPV